MPEQPDNSAATPKPVEMEIHARELQPGDLIFGSMQNFLVDRITVERVMTHSPREVRVYVAGMDMPVAFCKENDHVWIRRPGDAKSD